MSDGTEPRPARVAYGRDGEGQKRIPEAGSA